MWASEFLRRLSRPMVQLGRVSQESCSTLDLVLLVTSGTFNSAGFRLDLARYIEPGGAVVHIMSRTNLALY
jgi:hypothetical protein